MKHTVKKMGIIRPQMTKTGKASGPKGVKTPAPAGGTRKGPVGNPKNC